MTRSHDEIRGAAEVIPRRLYFACVQHPGAAASGGAPANSLCYVLDDDLIYEPFCADFGPCNLAHTYRFCCLVNQLLEQGRQTGQRVLLVVGPHPHKRANAAALVGIYSVLFLDRTPEEAHAPLAGLEPFAGFRDASCGMPTFTLAVADAIRGMWRAKQVGFIRWHEGEGFDVDEYEHYEQVENGDLNWIVPSKFMAFSGPSATPRHFGGWRTFMPEDYISYFRARGVGAVVRLNKKMYEASRFTQYGVRHYEMYFPDGTCPSDAILYRFLDVAEREGPMAVHCKAGLGRTGVLICAYMIKHFGFTAHEAMGYIRVCRPGSVIGPQQHYLIQVAPKLAQQGAALRRAAAGSPRSDVALLAGSAEAAEAAKQASAAAAKASVASSRAIISITATARAGEAAAAPAPSVRRSPRHSGAKPLEPPSRSSSTSTAGVATPQRSAAAADLCALRSLSSAQLSSVASSATGEPAYMVSVPAGQAAAPAAAPKPGHSRGAPTHVHVSMAEPAAVPPPPSAAQTAAHDIMMAGSRAREAAGADKAAAAAAAGLKRTATSTPPCTPVRSHTPAPLAPPSSSKRMLAPNGQPRKIPMAMDFADVKATDLEDREAADSWSLSSRPVASPYPGSSRVGAFAAAAGRGASAFVEAFRHAVTSYRSNYSSARRGGAGAR